HDALEKWRGEKMKDCGFGDDDFFGPQLVLTDEALDRIVDLAHDYKLPDLKTLRDQVNWCYVDSLGSEIITLVKEFFPPLP
ncbi:hypothetical protein CY34DRAFT_59074, partial [Suillus luteus UH-Slu-Lm8-n1]